MLNFMIPICNDILLLSNVFELADIRFSGYCELTLRVMYFCLILEGARFSTGLCVDVNL